MGTCRGKEQDLRNSKFQLREWWAGFVRLSATYLLWVLLPMSQMQQPQVRNEMPGYEEVDVRERGV